MCWSGEASAALAFTGFASTAFFYRRGESQVLCLALAYFSLMELLQAYTYSVIDQCLNPNNQIATFLGYMHIAFQPFFVNAVSMHFIPEPSRKRIAPFVYILCFAAATVFMMRIYPFQWSSFCFDHYYQFLPGTHLKFLMPFCGTEICSTSGQWHIAWAIPASGSIQMANSYVYAAFLMPLLYGSWKLVLYHFTTGPLLAYLTTNDMNEWAAVWCLYSIGLLLLLIKTPIRQYLYVTNWYGCRYPQFFK
ncbi:hypothetical protein JWZ98_09520 [Methylomonas sp. EFPC1]|uniref:DUF5765 domain-containing protein n=1 Tax=Methylomonas sp. EFPC1 TaxID=2812647 RepID=UPI0019683C35|nr:DUF5765 domain-containing protein [Methylomonas sp. EFPC1]QSB03142.1 hypothetical protein JWZ98_09520 [Methylomonas sp. EFPC1]